MIKLQYKQIDDNLYFRDIEHKSYMNTKIRNDEIWIEMLKVEIEFRKNKIATYFMEKVIAFFKTNKYKTIKLNILPCDSYGLNLEQLKEFYKKFGFETIYSTDISNKNIMKLNLDI